MGLVHANLVALLLQEKPAVPVPAAPLVDIRHLAHMVIMSVVFVAIGVAVFGIAFWLITKVTPFSIRKEIEDDQNTALGIVIGAVILGLAWIIAAAID